MSDSEDSDEDYPEVIPFAEERDCGIDWNDNDLEEVHLWDVHSIHHEWVKLRTWPDRMHPSDYILKNLKTIDLYVDQILSPMLQLVAANELTIMKMADVGKDKKYCVSEIHDRDSFIASMRMWRHYCNGLIVFEKVLSITDAHTELQAR